MHSIKKTGMLDRRVIAVAAVGRSAPTGARASCGCAAIVDAAFDLVLVQPNAVGRAES